MTGFEGIHKPILGAPKMAPGERVRYVPNHASFGAFMKSKQMRDPVKEVAEAIAEQAAVLSPVSDRGGEQEGKRMRDQFKVASAGLLKVAGNLRVMEIVYNNARSAAPNEFGTRKNKRHRMLGRAGAKFGDFKPKGGPG